MSNDNILVGMKAITAFLKVSDKVVRRWMAEHPDMPITKDGQLLSHAVELDTWYRARFTRGCEQSAWVIK